MNFSKNIFVNLKPLLLVEILDRDKPVYASVNFILSIVAGYAKQAR
jgi:hypothetical protein